MNRKAKRKGHLLITFTFIIIFTIGIYSYACYVFIPKNRSDLGANLFYHGKDFLYENANSLDVMFYGDSNTRLAIAPAYLKDKYNINSYNCGINGQTISGIDKYVAKTLKKQKLKVICIDVNALDTIDFGYINSHYMYFGSPFMYGIKWKNFNSKDFFGKVDLHTSNDLSRGYVYATYNYKFANLNNYMKTNKDFSKFYGKANLNRLEKILKKYKNYKIVLTQFPNPENWSNKRHNKVQKLADKYFVPFIDFNIEKNKNLFDLKKDMADRGGHINSYGAQKASDFLGKYIVENYGDILNKNLNVDDKLWENSIERLKKEDTLHVFYKND